MKRTVLHAEIASTYGGSVRSLETFLKASRRNDRLRHLVCLYSPLPEIPRLEKLGARVFLVPREFAWAGWVAKARALRELQLVSWFARLLAREEVDLVRLNNSPLMHRSLVMAAFLTGRPCVGWLRSFPRKSGLARLQLSLLGIMMDGLVTNSDAVREAFIRHGLSPRKIDTIHNGTYVPSRPRDAPRGEALRVATVGRLVAWKGLPCFVEAASMVAAQDPRMRFEIIGDDDPSEPGVRCELMTRIAQLGLEERIHLRGFAKDTEALYKSLYCLVNPSFPAEPFGNSIIEAMAWGCPVIATDSGGPREIIEHERSGILVRPNSPGALAAALVRLAQDPLLYTRIAEQAHLRVKEKFEIHQQSEKQEAFFDRVIRQGRGLRAVLRGLPAASRRLWS